MRKIKIVLIAMLALFVLIIITVPMVNNMTARNVKRTLEASPLPNGAEFCESISLAGKLTGSGNGMQFFGAILIRTEQSIDEVENHYSKFRENDWSYIVDAQEGEFVAVLEHESLSFDILEDEVDLDNFYIVYTWGDSDYPLSMLDIRGH